MANYTRNEKATLSAAGLFLAGGLFLIFGFYFHAPQTVHSPVGFNKSSRKAIFENEMVRTGVKLRQVILIGDIRFELGAETSLSASIKDNRFTVDVASGKFEMHIPPNQRLRLSTKIKSLDLGSVNGGRVRAQIFASGELQVQNVAGDIVARLSRSREVQLSENISMVVDRNGDLEISPGFYKVPARTFRGLSITKFATAF